MSTPTFFPPPAPSGWVPPRPTSSRVRVHAGIALGVIGIVGSFGSTLAFLVVALMGDGCGFNDSPPVCTSPGLAWALMLGPASVTVVAGALALVGVVVGGGRRGHAWPIAAWIAWLAGGAGWLIALSSVSVV